MAYNNSSANRSNLLPEDNFGRRIGIALAVSVGVNFLLLYGASVLASDMTITPPKRAAEIVITNRPTPTPESTPTPEATPTPTPTPEARRPKPTPTPARVVQPTPTPQPRRPEPTPTPERPQPTPTPEVRRPQPTPTPEPERPQPTPTPRVVKTETNERPTERTEQPVERNTSAATTANPNTTSSRTPIAGPTGARVTANPNAAVNVGGLRTEGNRSIATENPRAGLPGAPTTNRSIRTNTSSDVAAPSVTAAGPRTSGANSAAATAGSSRAPAAMPGGGSAAQSTVAVNVTSDNPTPTRQAETAVGSTGVALGRNKVIAMTKETAEVTRTDFVTQSGGALRSATVVAAQGSSSSSPQNAPPYVWLRSLGLD